MPLRHTCIPTDMKSFIHVYISVICFLYDTITTTFIYKLCTHTYIRICIRACLQTRLHESRFSCDNCLFDDIRACPRVYRHHNLLQQRYHGRRLIQAANSYIGTTLPHYTEMGHSSLDPQGKHNWHVKLHQQTLPKLVTI